MNADAGTRGTDNARPTPRDRSANPDSEARPAGASTTRRPGGQNEAKRLLLLDKGFESFGEPYNSGHLDGEAQIRLFTVWNDIARVLGEYIAISELTILGHGSPGGFLFTQGSRRTHMSLPDTVAWYQSHREVTRPKVEVVHLQSCNVGLKPDPLVGFGKLFQASEIIAWNHFYVCTVDTLDIPRGVDREQVVKRFDKRDYLAPGIDLDDLVRHPGKHKVLVEWFRVDYDEARLPPAARSPFDLGLARKHFKPAARQVPRIVRSPAKLKELSEELSEWGFREPERPLYRIIVKLAGFSAGTPDPPNTGVQP